jgi:hypothetical protein
MNWSAIGSIATVVGALATAAAAGFTAWMAYLTQSALKQSREQYQDGFRPTLVFLPHHSASEGDVVRMRALVFAFMPPIPTIGRLALLGAVRNIGVGPAINVRMTLRIRGIERYGPDPLSLPPIGAGDFFGNGEDLIHLPMSYRNGFTNTDAQSAPGEDWDLLLEYEDVFGQVFHTVHAKNQQRPWTTIGLGSAPKGRDARDVESELQAMSRAQAQADTSVSLSAP